MFKNCVKGLKYFGVTFFFIIGLVANVGTGDGGNGGDDSQDAKYDITGFWQLATTNFETDCPFSEFPDIPDGTDEILQNGNTFTIVDSDDGDIEGTVNGTTYTTESLSHSEDGVTLQCLFTWGMISSLSGLGSFNCTVSQGSNSCMFEQGFTLNKSEGILSSGLKIFVTREKHVGDFLNDPTLTGENAIEKADDFCGQDQNKPDGSVYKALLVDSITRDAVTQTNWILQPNTTYFRVYNDVEIGTTSNRAIFEAFYDEMTNGVVEVSEHSPLNGAWTGIGDARDFSTGENCDNWSDANQSSSSGLWGIVTSRKGTAFSSPGGAACTINAPIYCVEQPK